MRLSIMLASTLLPSVCGCGSDGSASVTGSSTAAGATGGVVSAPAGGGGAGGTSPGGAASTGGAGVPSGGAPAGGAPAGGAGGLSLDDCVIGDWCRDGDGDGSGDPTTAELACVERAPGWTLVCDDCHDGLDGVHPGAACNPLPFTAVGTGASSFDFDCDGVEALCGAVELAAPEGCRRATLQTCSGGGYLPNSARTAEPGQNPVCGSTEFQVCAPLGAVPCVPVIETRDPVPCH